MATIGTYGNPAISSYVIDADGYFVATNVEAALAEIYVTKNPVNQGYLSGFTITDEGGLNISWTAGTIFDFNNQQIVVVEAGAGACATDVINYLYWNAGAILAIGVVEPTGNQVLIAEIYCQANDIFHTMEMGALDRREHWMMDALDNIFPNIVTNGLAVTEDPNVVNTWDVQMAAGIFYHNVRVEHEIAAIVYSRVTVMRRWYHVGGVWTSDTNAEIDITQYDNGANLVAVTPARYHRSVFFTDGYITHWVYPQAEYANVAAAVDAPDPTLPPGLQNLPKLTAVIIQTGDIAFPAAGSDQWIDVRPMIGQAVGAPVTDHGGMSGLADDDHLQYVLADGTRAITGAFTIQGLLTSDGVVPEADLADDLGTALLTWQALYVQDIYDAAGNMILSNDGVGNIDALANLSCNIVFTGAQTVDGVDISAISLSNMPAAASGNIDAGGQAITNVGNVDGVDVSAIVAFTTITGITNDVVADALTDTLTLTSANAILTIVGTTATDTITFTIDETQISHDAIADVSVDDHHAQSHTIASHSDATLADPGVDRIVFWDETADKFTFLVANTGLSILGTDLNCDITQYTDAAAQAACVSDAVYGAGWDAVVDVAPSKNAVYDQLVTHYANTDEHHAQSHTIVSHSDATLADPAADQIVFWDDSDSKFEFLVANTGLSITDNNLNCDITQYTDADALAHIVGQDPLTLTNGLTIGGALAGVTTLGTTGDVIIGGDLTVTGNDIKGSDGTQMTMNANGVEFQGNISIGSRATSATIGIYDYAAGTRTWSIRSTDGGAQILASGATGQDAIFLTREGTTNRLAMFYDASQNDGRIYHYTSTAMITFPDGGGIEITPTGGDLELENAELDMTGALACIDLNPAGTGSKNIIDITPSAALDAGSVWRGVYANLYALDPATGVYCTIEGVNVTATGIVSVDKDAAIWGYVFHPSVVEDNVGYYYAMAETTQANKYQTCFYSALSAVLSVTATYRGLRLNWSGATRDANAPILEGIRVELPADYTGFGANFAAYFTGDGRSVTICDTTYALNVSGAMQLNGVITGVNSIALDLGTSINEFSIDGTLAGNSDDALPTEQAVKTYVDAAIAGVNSLAEVLALGNESDGTDVILDEGSDLIVYSDDKVTEKARIDGATGNITTAGTVDGVDISTIVAFKTITGITNDVVADGLTDTLTFTSANDRLTIVGTAATDTITFTLVEANISHDAINDVSVDDHHAQSHTIVSHSDATLADPAADQIVFWDDSDSKFEFLVANTGLSITDNNLNCDITQYTDGLARTACLEDDVYGAGWDGDVTHAPTQNAVYDKIAAMDILIAANTTPAEAIAAVVAENPLTLTNALNIGSIVAGVADYDKFLVSDGGLVKFRTGAEVLGDIGASASGHLHDLQTLQLDGINSDGGAFPFTTSGVVQFSNALAGITDLSMIGQLDMTGADAWIDLNPAGTGTKQIIDITPSANLVAGSIWNGVRQSLGGLDPATGAFTIIKGFEVVANFLESDDGNLRFDAFVTNACPADDTQMFRANMTELTADKVQTGFLYDGGTKNLSVTGTYQGVYIDWDGLTRELDAAPVLQGIIANLPADYSNFGACYAGYFSGDGRSVTICDTTYALDISGAIRITGAMNLAGAITGVTSLNMSGDLTAANIVTAGNVDGVDVSALNTAYLAHLHDTQTLQLDGINSGGGAFPFTTTGTVTFNQAVTIQGLLTADGLVPEAASADNLGSTSLEWLNLYIGTGRIYFGAGQEVDLYNSGNNLRTSDNFIIDGDLTVSGGSVGIGVASDAGYDIKIVTTNSSFMAFYKDGWKYMEFRMTTGGTRSGYFGIDADENMVIASDSGGSGTGLMKLIATTAEFSGNIQVLGNLVKNSAGDTMLQFSGQHIIFRGDLDTTYNTQDMATITTHWDECYADNWNNVSSWKTFSDPFAVLRTIGPSKEDEYEIDHSKVDAWLSSRVKAKVKNEKGNLEWEGGYVLKPKKAKKSARKVFVERLDKKVPVGNYSDGYSDEDFEHENAYSINKTQIVLIQAMNQLKGENDTLKSLVTNLEARINHLEDAS